MAASVDFITELIYTFLILFHAGCTYRSKQQTKASGCYITVWRDVTHFCATIVALTPTCTAGCSPRVGVHVIFICAGLNADSVSRVHLSGQYLILMKSLNFYYLCAWHSRSWHHKDALLCIYSDLKKLWHLHAILVLVKFGHSSGTCLNKTWWADPRSDSICGPIGVLLVRPFCFSADPVWWFNWYVIGEMIKPCISSNWNVQESIKHSLLSI